jgi:hypothetical protein
MTHEDFIEKYSSLLEDEGFIQMQFQRGSGQIDDAAYLEKLIGYGVTREDGLAYIEADKKLSDQIEGMTILMMNELDADLEFLKKQYAEIGPESMADSLIEKYALTQEEAKKAVAFLAS